MGFFKKKLRAINKLFHKRRRFAKIDADIEMAEDAFNQAELFRTKKWVAVIGRICTHLRHMKRITLKHARRRGI